MTRVMVACDSDQIYCSCCERFSGTVAKLGGFEYGYGLAAEIQDALLGEPAQGAREGFAGNAGRLGHLLARERGPEDDAPLGHPTLFGGEVQEHAGYSLRRAVENGVADPVLELAGA